MWFLLSLFLDLNKITRNGPVSGFTLLGLKWLDIGIALQHDSGMSVCNRWESINHGSQQ